VIRDVIEDELEQAFSGKKTPRAALDSSVARGNELLRQFEQATREVSSHGLGFTSGFASRIFSPLSKATICSKASPK
jgi:hypothetical protein